LAKQNPLVAGDKLHTRIWCSIWSFYLHLIFVVYTYLYMNLIKKKKLFWPVVYRACTIKKSKNKYLHHPKFFFF
jgi:hypothetical protein